MMLPTFLLGLFLSAYVAAQAQVLPEDCSFTYQGCAIIDVDCFSYPIEFPDGVVTAETCQRACNDHLFAALFPDGCRCGDDASAITPVDEMNCNVPCMGDPDLGPCGGLCPGYQEDIGNYFVNNLLIPFEIPLLPPTETPGPQLPPVPEVGLPEPFAEPLGPQIPSETPSETPEQNSDGSFLDTAPPSNPNDGMLPGNVPTEASDSPGEIGESDSPVPSPTLSTPTSLGWHISPTNNTVSPTEGIPTDGAPVPSQIRESKSWNTGIPGTTIVLGLCAVGIVGL
ncbi:hypothetical protein B0I35DRAFT_45210 [Stachybotrys elegans]|uniref:WSC domain-containing protein n=1 Tax=Stachybotrys elegans TaxID=80388 RepID=A0A8K0T943_9HYPO|nr:hypothetical protein B0I35DRAFT_45210 [Stachybotrys elegans]